MCRNVTGAIAEILVTKAAFGMSIRRGEVVTLRAEVDGHGLATYARFKAGG